MFTHPFLVHGRSTNCAPVGEAGVRFMCHPGVKLKDYPLSEPTMTLTPTEKAIAEVWTQDMGKPQQALYNHDECLKTWEERKQASSQIIGKRRLPQAEGQDDSVVGADDDEESDDLPEGVDEDVWAMMGIKGFGGRSHGSGNHHRKTRRRKEWTSFEGNVQ